MTGKCSYNRIHEYCRSATLLTYDEHLCLLKSLSEEDLDKLLAFLIRLESEADELVLVPLDLVGRQIDNVISDQLNFRV